MKKLIFLSILFIFSITACTGVDAGHKGVEISWGGQTNMKEVFPEGLHYGIGWLWNDMEEYDVRETTHKEKYTMNDKNSMPTGIEVSVDYNIDPNKVNLFHQRIGKQNFDIKIHKTIQSATMQVVPLYTAVDINQTKRAEVQKKIQTILESEFPGFYASVADVRITDVDIPDQIAKTAELTAKQLELNKLSASKVEEAQNKAVAAEYEAKANALLSQPAMLRLKELEVERIYAEKGVSKWGNNNVFGTGSGILLNRN